MLEKKVLLRIRRASIIVMLICFIYYGFLAEYFPQYHYIMEIIFFISLAIFVSLFAIHLFKKL